MCWRDVARISHQYCRAPLIRCISCFLTTRWKRPSTSTGTLPWPVTTTSPLATWCGPRSKTRTAGWCEFLKSVQALGRQRKPSLSAIYGRKVEYIFTDISPAFLARARSKFAEFPSVHYRVLNIENDPAEQGFQRGEYDIVIAANVLHATANLRRTIAHVQELLAPGGLALLLEGMRPDRGVDLTFGLTDGWWRFSDHDVRPDYPLVAADTWTRLLKEAGMTSTPGDHVRGWR